MTVVLLDRESLVPSSFTVGRFIEENGFGVGFRTKVGPDQCPLDLPDLSYLEISKRYVCQYQYDTTDYEDSPFPMYIKKNGVNVRAEPVYEIRTEEATVGCARLYLKYPSGRLPREREGNWVFHIRCERGPYHGCHFEPVADAVILAAKLENEFCAKSVASERVLGLSLLIDEPTDHKLIDVHKIRPLILSQNVPNVKQAVEQYFDNIFKRIEQLANSEKRRDNEYRAYINNISSN